MNDFLFETDIDNATVITEVAERESSLLTTYWSESA